ncbi:MAG: hypothetical protein M1118_05720 [Chloroflexi bacterium]|nr:hypothetical protein [Chloroflexota bacterium]
MRKLLSALAATVLLCTGCSSAGLTDTGLIGGPHVLTANLSSGRLLYVHDGSIELLTQGGSKELVHAQPGKGIYSDPTWSPNGQQIAFVLREKNYSDIGVMDTNGSNPVFLTHDESSVIQNNLWATSPTWSNDGQYLAFASDRGKDEATGEIDLRIWLMNVGTRGLTRLTTPFFQAGGDADPAFRPGHPGQLVYTKWRYAPNGSATYAVLMLLDLNTHQEYALTPLEETNFQPAWSPDGSVLAYVHRGVSSDDIVAATVPDQVTSSLSLKWTALTQGVDAQPCFSPDGQHLAFIGEKDNAFQLFEESVTLSPSIAVQGQPQQLTSDSVDATSRLSWVK